MIVQRPLLRPAYRSVQDEPFPRTTEEDEQRRLRRKMRVYPNSCLIAANQAEPQR